MSDQQVIDLLREAYVAEIETTMNYLAHSVNLDTFDGRDVGEELQADAQNEQDHALRLGNRLRVLGETALTSNEVAANITQESLNNISDTTDVLAVIDGVIEAEQSAIETYRNLVEVARENGDYGTASLAEELLQDEEQHLQEFKSLRRDFE